MNNETIQQIVDPYLTTDLTTRQIAEHYGTTASRVCRLVKQAGGAMRRPKSTYKGVEVGTKREKTKTVKSCPKCRRKIDLSYARFCPYCGSDIRSEGELLAERLVNLADLALYIPDERRDELVKALNEAANMVKKL